MYAIISPIKEVISIKKYFNWSFYKNDELIEEYKNLKIINNTYKINDNLMLITENNSYKLERINDDYHITIDFKNKNCTIKFLKENLFTEIPLLESEIVDKEDKLTIIYMLDEEERNNLVIDLKEW